MLKPRLNQSRKPKMGRGIRELFLDSGSHGLFNRFCVQKGNTYDWFDTKPFRQYMKQYAAFIAEHESALDYFVTTDVIFDPERSVKSTQYLERQLEKNGVKRRPVPVIHYGTEPKYLHRYLDEGHDLIGFGGLGQKSTSKAYAKWADRMFAEICPRSNGYKPIVKVHGFAMTSWWLITRYPWWSVDSTTYNKMAGYGWLLIPHWKNGKWDFSRRYHQIGVCDTPTAKVLKKYGSYYDRGNFSRVEEAHRPVFVSPAKRDGSKHMGSLENPNREMKKIVDRWLEFVGVPFGDENTPGVYNEFALRSRCNLLYFDMLQQSIPKWPGPFKPTRGRSLLDMIRDDAPPNHYEYEKEHPPQEIRIFFSGLGPKDTCAEEVLHQPQVMFTYWDTYSRNGKLDKRFQTHIKEREKCKS